MRVKMFTHTDLDGVDVSELAKLFGGGGHINSAGSEFDKLLVDQFINKIIN